MDDPETELSRFRKQWKEEVTARTQSTASSSKPKVSAPAPAFVPRRRSHSSSSAKDDAGEGESTVVPLLPGARDRSVSPVAVRRTSVSVPSVPGVPESALEHYEKAAEKEAQGSLGESLNLYRKAFRMDAKVDNQYREKYFPRPVPGSKGKEKEKEKPTPPTPPANSTPHPSAPPPSTLSSNSKELSALISSFAHLHIPPVPPSTEDSPKPPFSPLTTLPSELLLHILHDLAITDLATFARCAQVCRALAFLVMTEENIWRDICTTIYARMLWDWSVSIDGSPLPSPDPDSDSPDPDTDPPRTPPTDTAQLPTYSNNWRKMLLSRPRIRFNGIYISTCNYVRSGASQTWNTPVHIVTYYRYLRFYPDGTALSLLSSVEPTEVVHAFSKRALTPAHLRDMQTPGGPVAAGGWARCVSRGRWRMDPEGRVDVETEGSMDRYWFRMQMRVGSVRAGGRVVRGSAKLLWEGFWSWNRLTDDLAEFSLRNDKAFFFSRVGGYEREAVG